MEIRYHSLVYGLGGSHVEIVIIDNVAGSATYGQEWHYNGYHSDSGEGPSGQPGKLLIDRNYPKNVDGGHVQVVVDNKQPAKRYVNAADEAASEINEAGINYRLTGPNSNSAGRELLEKMKEKGVGVKVPADPDRNAIGWGKDPWGDKPAPPRVRVPFKPGRGPAGRF